MWHAAVHTNTKPPNKNRHCCCLPTAHLLFQGHVPGRLQHELLYQGVAGRAVGRPGSGDAVCVPAFKRVEKGSAQGWMASRLPTRALQRGCEAARVRSHLLHPAPGLVGVLVLLDGQ